MTTIWKTFPSMIHVVDMTRFMCLIKWHLLTLVLLSGHAVFANEPGIVSPLYGAAYAVGVPVTFQYTYGQATGSWTFGDGTSVYSPVSRYPGSCTHSYASPGTYQVRLFCPGYYYGPGGNAYEPGATVITTIHILPKINSFSASPMSIYQGQSAYLTWSVTGTSDTTLSINQGVGVVSTSSSAVRPTTTTTYTLTASNPHGSQTATCTVTMNSAPTITSFTAAPLSINRGQNVTLAWSTTGADVSLSLDHGVGIVEGTSCVVQPVATTAYTLSASNPGGEVSSASATITVNQPPSFNWYTLPPAFTEGQAISFALPTATDPENDAISTYGATGLPAGLSFDPASRILSGSVAAPGGYRFTYTATDAKGAVASTPVDLDIQAVGGPGSGYTTTITYRYDTQGRLSTLTYPSGRVVGYTYDTLDRITQVTQNWQPVVQQISYDNWSNPNLLQFKSGAMDQYAYDPVSGTRVTQWTIGTVGGLPDARTYTYNALDRLTKAGEWSNLAYDGKGRLAYAAGFGLIINVAHDGYDNNIYYYAQASGVLPPSLNNYPFTPLADNHLPGVATNGGITQVSEDYFGEITNLGTGISSSDALSMTWDALGRMISTTLGGATESNGYTASGLRVVRRDSLNSQLNRLYAYTNAGQLLSEYTTNSAPVWTRDVIYLGNRAIAEVDTNGVHELHSDHLGSPRVITGAAGTVEGTQAYGPYGELLTNFTSGYVPLTGYTGHLQTEPTGLIYMRGRFYSPAWHRFMNSDQGVDPGGLNQFCYVIGTPLMHTDPSGMRDPDAGYQERDKKEFDKAEREKPEKITDVTYDPKTKVKTKNTTTITSFDDGRITVVTEVEMEFPSIEDAGAYAKSVNFNTKAALVVGGTILGGSSLIAGGTYAAAKGAALAIGGWAAGELTTDVLGPVTGVTLRDTVNINLDPNGNLTINGGRTWGGTSTPQPGQLGYPR